MTMEVGESGDIFSKETSPLYKLNHDLLRLLILRIKENNFPIKLLLQNVLQPNIQVERYFFLIQYNFLYNFFFVRCK